MSDSNDYNMIARKHSWSESSYSGDEEFQSIGDSPIDPQGYSPELEYSSDSKLKTCHELTTSKNKQSVGHSNYEHGYSDDNGSDIESAEKTVQSSRKRKGSSITKFPSKKFHSGDSSDGSELSGSLSYQSLVNQPSEMSYYSPEKELRSHMYESQHTNVQTLDKPYEGTVGTRLMQKMGYVSGEGLGRERQGRKDPVELSKQSGTHGLGYKMEEISVDPTVEPLNPYATLREEIVWLFYDNCPIEIDSSWCTIGTKNLKIDEMTDFCYSNIIDDILESKDKLAVFSKSEDLMSVKLRCNPFEKIMSGIFLNRAAMKMANMDFAFDFMFTDPRYMNNELMLSDKTHLLYFADVCAGPGGFSEYVLWRKKWRAKGFGFTLKESNDFKLEDFLAGPCETFEPYYGKNGDGDVYNPENIRSLQKLVLDSTNQEGVHFMMADGGFSVKGKEDIQELLSKQLYLCQFLVALLIVRDEGHFVCKIFDLFSPFSVGLVYLMYKSFHQICIFKPNTSRPANSERYIVCKHKRTRSECRKIAEYMFQLNETLIELEKEDSSKDITHCVPMEIIADHDSHFFKYIFTSNNKLGKLQIDSLKRILLFHVDKNLTIEHSQNYYTEESLKLWGIPREIRSRNKPSIEDILKNISFTFPQGFNFKVQDHKLSLDLDSTFESIYSWDCLILGGKEGPSLYLGMGRNRVARWNGKWIEERSEFQLSPGTLVLGEVISEFREWAHRKVREIPFLHIIDAYALGGEDISTKMYHRRMEYCAAFCKALEKQSSCSPSCVKVTPVFNLYEIGKLFDRINSFYFRSESMVLKTNDFICQAKGIIFLRTTRGPWNKCFSNTAERFYFHAPNNNSTFEQPPPSIADFKYCFQNCITWIWDIGCGIKGEPPRDGVLHKNDVISYVSNKTSSVLL